MFSVRLGLAFGLFLVAGVAMADPLAPYAKPARLIRLADGRDLNLVCMGQGAPTVILDAGWSSWSLDWASVQAELARSTQVCAYDRAGLGFSTPDPMAKTLATVVADQAEMLDRAGIKGPLVLVGGSKAAVFVRAFTAAHPEQVAGLVLVDPGSPERDEAFNALDAEVEARALAEILQSLTRCVDRAKAGLLTTATPEDAFCLDEGEADWSAQLKASYRVLVHSVSYAETRLAEIRIDNALPPSARGEGALGDRPLIVLKSDQGLSKAIPEPRRSALDKASRAAAEDLAKLSRRGEFRLVANSGHVIANDRPDAVIAAIRAVVDGARSLAEVR